MSSTNTFRVIASAFSILLYIACNTPVIPPGQGQQLPTSKPFVESNLLTQAQIDSLQTLIGKNITQSLWRTLFEEDFKEIPIMMLSGNMDQDPEPELAFWYYWEGMRAMGEITLLDSTASGWKKLGSEYLSFYYETIPPSIDTANRMLLTYSYGSGSGYRSDVLEFYQIRKDSLVCVFKLLETENLCLLGSGALRSIHAQYKCKDSSQIVATYRYQVNAGDNNRHREKLVFKAQLSMPFFWDETRQRYLPKLPKDFPPLNSMEGYLDEGESSFDQFYDPQLQQLKWHGPRWKREALCNPYEN
jgi:hypothetical protein